MIQIDFGVEEEVAPVAKAKAKAKAKKRRKPKQPERLEAQDYIIAIDASLQRATGKGLKRFQSSQEEEEAVESEQQPVLICVLTKGRMGGLHRGGCFSVPC